MPNTTGDYRLYAAQGCGSAIVEALLTLADAPFSTIELGYKDLGLRPGKLQELNPLGQVPTLVLPDGAVMTESAAITLHIAEQFPGAGLAPPVDDPVRSQFLRWLVFFGSPIYATFTYGDKPDRWAPAGEAARALRKTTDEHRQSLWRYLEGQVTPSPWLLGRKFSALDIFISVMTRWRPGRDWFAANCPGLLSAAHRVDNDERLRPIWQRNFP
jgi:GST-like protein